MVLTPAGATCDAVDNDGTCEFGENGPSCHTGGLADSPNCFTPCA